MRRIDELFMKYPFYVLSALESRASGIDGAPGLTARWSASCGGTAFASAVTGFAG